jgi:hypothetical protein
MRDGRLKSQKVGKPFYKRAWFIVIAVFVGLAIIGACMPNPDDNSKPNTAPVADSQIIPIETIAEETPPPIEEPIAPTTIHAFNVEEGLALLV